MTQHDDQPAAPLLRALSDADASRVAGLLDAVGVDHTDLEPVLTEPDADALIDRFLHDEVHAPRA